MKKTQRIEAFRNIRRNRVSFLSIVFISLMAVTAYLGLSFSAEGIRKSGDAAYAADRTADIEINAASPMTRSDLEKVLGTEGVADAEGILFASSRVGNGVETRDIMLRTLSERISLPELSEGAFPASADECAVEKTLADRFGYRPGDRLSLKGRNADTDAVIGTTDYTVTGIFTTADHLTDLVSYEPILLVTRDAFNPAVVQGDVYTAILVRINADDPYRFSQSWRDSAERICDNLEPISNHWIFTPLHNTASYVCTEEHANLLSTVSLSFSLLFILLAALVIYSTIGRLVEHERQLTGASKAMGLRNSEIFAKYMLFGAGGAMAGTAGGILLSIGFERLVVFFVGGSFLFRKQLIAFLPVPTVLIVAGAALLSFASVYFACHRLIKSSAVSLMNGEVTGRKIRKKKASGRGSLYLRLIFRNMRMDWKRVLVSIFSIAGSCTLLMIGFCLKYSVSRVPEKQYDKIQRYSMVVAADITAYPESLDSLSRVLDEEKIPYCAAYMADVPYMASESHSVLTMICPAEGETFAEEYCFTDVSTRKTIALPESGMLVSRMFAVKYDLKPGDSFTLYDIRMTPHQAEIAGVFENYVGVSAICTSAYAEECMGYRQPCNTLLLRNVQDPEGLRQKLSGVEGFISLASAKKQETLLNGISSTLNLVILMLGILSVLIAAFILLNLVDTYVKQKKNELTIMRINGYTTAETIRYASMECYGITLLGILVGLGSGFGFATDVRSKIDQLSLSFVAAPHWVAFVASAAITAVISWGLHYLAFRKIRNLKLSDIQK